MQSQFKQVKVNSNSATCAECKDSLMRGADALASFERDRTGVQTTFICDEICLADYRERNGSKVNRLLNKVSTQFN